MASINNAARHDGGGPEEFGSRTGRNCSRSKRSGSATSLGVMTRLENTGAETCQTDLPGTLAEIAEVTDVETAMKVAATVGGRRAYFAANPTSDNWLTMAVGHEAANAIGSQLAPGKSGIELEVPLGPMGARARTWRRIHEMIAAGATKSEIARATGVHPKTVQRHRNGHSGFKARVSNQRPGQVDKREP